MIEKFAQLLGALPSETIPAVGRLLAALLSGDVAKAQREAKFVAEGISAKQAIRAGYRARGK